MNFDELIISRREEILKIARRNGATNISLFGSVAPDFDTFFVKTLI